MPRTMVAGPSHRPFSDFVTESLRNPQSSLPDSATATRSWAIPNDVSADELYLYLQSVVGGTVEPDGAMRTIDGLSSSTRFGETPPFAYADAGMPNKIGEFAATDRGAMMACDIISSECKGSVLREFPGQYLDSTLNRIQSEANAGVKDARKALKLLNDNRFKK
ncbi:hypothetical protein [Burkholderia anthina]|uniref:hypothetical protein n=1 Tax=Burkholderia anthina TaxID=179879 RepID=UPI00158DCDE8